MKNATGIRRGGVALILLPLLVSGEVLRGDRGVVHVDCHPVLVRAASVLRLALLYHRSPGTRPRSFNFIFVLKIVAV